MRLYCPVCGEAYPLETEELCCPESTDKGVHPFVKQEEGGELERVFPAILTKRWNDGKISFSVFREFMASYQLANAHGKASWWVDRVIALSNACERLTGRGFVRTPEVQADELAQAIDLPAGSLFIKNETLQLTGSHKSRHLAGVIMHLETLREIAGESAEKKTLATIGYGSTAIAAAALASAAGYKLYVFLPDSADAETVALLTNLGAVVVKAGDKEAVHTLYSAALKKFGWIPFTTCGRDIWSAVEGAETMEYEFLFNQYLSDAPLDVQVVQVGCGGMANAVSSANALFKRLDIIRKLPRFYTCQTTGCYPLAQSYFSVLREMGRDGVITLSPELAMQLEGDFDAQTVMENNLGQIKMTAGLIAEMYPKIKDDIETVLKRVGENRNDFFKPWANEIPTSVATGILDDTTYDGLEVVRAMLISGGLPLIVDEDSLQKAFELAKKYTSVNTYASGSAGLAGLRFLIKNKLVQQGERCGLLFTGVGEHKCDLPIVSERVLTASSVEELSKLIA